MTLQESRYVDNRRPQFDWNEDRVADLARMWSEEEMSATDIAVHFGVTRNSVLGKIDRLGLQGRPCDVFHRSNGAARREARKKMLATGISARAVRRLFRSPQQPAETVARSPYACTLVELDDTKCHFPIGDPDKDGFHFCGGTAEHARGPYCDEHYGIAYRSRG